MIARSRIDYLKTQLLRHCGRFFSDEASQALQKTEIIFENYSEAVQRRASCIAVPIDIEAPIVPENQYTAPFNETELTLYNRLPRPDGEGWACLPDETHPIWYRHQSGTLIPAWNLYHNLFDLLTFREDREDSRRDIHGRFIAAYSPRCEKNLLETPAFNEAAAALVGAALGLQQDSLPWFELDGHVQPPMVVLSHDCDILSGNDLWTQSVRAYRILQPLIRLRPPHLQNMWWIIRNAVRPRDYYFDNAKGMIALEQIFDFESTFYMLNGSGGRFGARSGSKIIAELMPHIPDRDDVGIHYNYDTHLDNDKFSAQQTELNEVTGRTTRVGRAHYLRFDHAKSFDFWAAHDITTDESVGYPDRIGYRCGIGGCFQPYDIDFEQPLKFREIPIDIMEATLLSQYGDGAVDAFERMLRHLKQVGGAVSMVVHPGMFFNPEFPETRGFYHRLLIVCRRLGAVSQTASVIADNVHPR